ncbi:putative beta-glucosidase A [Cryomyces antarcticus]|uniref:beta-glucosidase n=1 Tax=Cryomyces antarcticus TaxID=329879 RepID=A0ABR0LR42_9PEZI|nr:beta-glucosidase [Cryomyces antarcticus]KAK5202137.1 beta-glucosidase [Cryomyces antarcticus]
MLRAIAISSVLLPGLVAAQVAGAQSGQTSPPSYPSPWMEGGDGWDDAYAKAKAFVSQLSLLEKVNLTTGVGWEGEQCVGNTGSIPRLNFRGFCMQDSPLGVRFADLVSAFPAGINTAATWSRTLFNARGSAMGSEHRGKGVDVQLGPVAGPLGRVPEGGRNWEGFSPDPVLTGVAMAETIKGIQGAGVIACAKHYILNEQEHFRDKSSTSEASSSNMDDTTMHETYLWPFADAVKAGVGSVMCSYNQINNSYGCQKSYTLNHILKNELDFQGFVMSDWAAQHAGVASALAGLDMTMPGDQGFDSNNSYWGGNLTASIINGTVPQWRLDDMAVRIMSAYFKVGRDSARVPVNFDSWTTNTTGYLHALDPTRDVQVVNQHVNVQDDHAKLIRQIGQRSTVLLKNTNGALPLHMPASVAVIGEDAHSNPGGPNNCSDRGCDIGTLAMGWGSGTANFPYLVAPVDALRAQAATDNSRFANYSNNYDLKSAQMTAANASVAIVFVNADSGEGYITVDGNAGDRNNLTLWGNGDALVAAVASSNKNTIVVMHTVGPVIVEAMKNNPNVSAILWAGLPGQESGNAITDILYGKANPAAKSVFTWGKDRADWGVDVLYTANGSPPQIDFTEGNFIDYRHFDQAGIAPSYEFGFGLSYTTFSYSNLQIQKQNAAAYVPTTGQTKAAPTFGTIDTSVAANSYPPGFDGVNFYIYPYLDSTTPVNNGTKTPVPPNSQSSSPQPKLPAGGAPGGNSGLYDVLYTVTAKITNTGKVDGIEVPQMYVSLGGPNDPKIVLRGFDDLSIKAGQSATFKADIQRRDISNWDPVSQNWVISSYPKTVYVGSSSRNLPLKAVLNGNNNNGGYGGNGNNGGNYGNGGYGNNNNNGGNGNNGGNYGNGGYGNNNNGGWGNNGGEDNNGGQDGNNGQNGDGGHW